MKIGYARVSTSHQNLDAQIKALELRGCEKIFKETESSRKERKELKTLLGFVREGDTIYITKLDRLGRSLKELIDILHYLDEKSINIVAIDDNIDTSSKFGKMLFNFFALFAEMELTFNKERREKAKTIGRQGGRKTVLTDELEKHIITLYQAKENNLYIYSLSEIVKSTKVSKPTIYKCLNKNNIPLRNE